MGARVLLYKASRNCPLPIAAALGAAMGFYPGVLPFCAFLSLVAASTAAALGIALVNLPRDRIPEAKRLGQLCLVWSVAAIAGLALARDSVDAWFPDQVDFRLHAVSGRLSTDSSPGKNGFRSYALDVEGATLRGPGMSCDLSFYGPGIERGAALTLLVRAGPALDAGTAIDARGYLAAGNKSAGPNRPVFFANSKDFGVRDRGTWVDRARGSLRESCGRSLRAAGRESSGLLEALLLGNRDNLDIEDAEAFKAAGCAHILALSGQHLSVLAMLALGALKPLLGPRRALFGAALLAAVFMWIAGAGPSLLRSVIMVWIGAVALALDRPQGSANLLALTFLVALPFDPAAARSLSFTLSYAAIIGLAVIAPRCEYCFDPWLPPVLSKAVSASLGAQLAVTPLLAFTFGAAQPVGIVASMVSGPLVTAMMWWGMGGAFLSGFLPPSRIAVQTVSDLLYRLLVGTMKTAATAAPLDLGGMTAKIAACTVVLALVSLFLARPDADYRAWRRLAGKAER